MEEVFVDGVRIVRDSGKDGWIVEMNKNSMLVEVITEPGKIYQYQSLIFSSKMMGQNKVAHVTGPREQVDEESLRFFVEKMVKIQGRVPKEMQSGLYLSLWSIIEPFYPY